MEKGWDRGKRSFFVKRRLSFLVSNSTSDVVWRQRTGGFLLAKGGKKDEGKLKFSREYYIPQPADKLVGITKWYRDGLTLEDSITIEREVSGSDENVEWVYEYDQFPDPTIGRNTGQWVPVKKPTYSRDKAEREPFREGGGHI